MNPLALEVREYVKAIVAALIACLAVLTAQVGGGLHTVEVLGAVGTFLATFAGTFAAPNKAPEDRLPDPTLSEQGYGEDSYLIRICVIIIVVALTVYLLKILF